MKTYNISYLYKSSYSGNEVLSMSMPILGTDYKHAIRVLNNIVKMSGCSLVEITSMSLRLPIEDANELVKQLNS